jgi:hypothetical protein
VGCPIRTPTDQRLLAAPRGFAQRATSFFASWCQGIHRMPLLCSKPLRRPRTRTCAGQLDPRLPCTETILSTRGRGSGVGGQKSKLSNHRQRSADHPSRMIPHGSVSLSAARRTRRRAQLSPLNPSGGGQANPPVRHAAASRPETHQNPIYPDKDPARSNGPPAPRRQRGTAPNPSLARYPNSVVNYQSSVVRKTTDLETIGLEPTTPCLQSRCSPS